MLAQVTLVQKWAILLQRSFSLIAYVSRHHNFDGAVRHFYLGEDFWGNL